MSRTRAICIAACLLGLGASVLIGVVSLSDTPQEPVVRMVLQTVSLTNGPQPVAVFVVTNVGPKAVFLSFHTRDTQEGGDWRALWLPMLGAFGSCSVPPRTNCTARIVGPSGPARWRVHATVFETASTLEKGKFAAGRLWARLSGRGDFTAFWISDLGSPAYELRSQEVPGFPRSSSQLGGSLEATEAEDTAPLSLDFD